MEDFKGKASTRAKNKYNAANYDSLRIVVPKGRKADIEAYVNANSSASSVNGLVNALLRDVLGMSEEEWRSTTEYTGGA